MLTVQNIHKRFGKEEVLKGLSFELAQYQMLSVLGRSGSGKTTLLKIIAGLESTGEGEVYLRGKSLLHIAPQNRNIVYLYQEALLFPHLNVFDNIAFGLRIRKLPKREIQSKTDQMISDLDLSEQAYKMPHQLSGGQKQRVSFGRALIINPEVLLLDEPFGNLDVETRRNMQALLKQMAGRYKITAIFVTHDLKEAILMGDKIGYMRAGELDIYEDLQAFISDPKTEAQGEIDFWKRMSE